MKKILSAIVAASLALVCLVGCSGMTNFKSVVGTAKEEITKIEIIQRTVENNEVKGVLVKELIDEGDRAAVLDALYSHKIKEDAALSDATAGEFGVRIYAGGEGYIQYVPNGELTVHGDYPKKVKEGYYRTEEVDDLLKLIKTTFFETK